MIRAKIECIHCGKHHIVEVVQRKYALQTANAHKACENCGKKHWRLLWTRTVV